MSPAKRKSAKSGRAASVAARGGKARGKARGSALTKAVKVRGKTPAGREDHRLAARSGARAGARNGAGVACEMPREELELLLDRDGGRADVLTHVPACHPCTTSLTVIASQRDAIRHLTAEPSGTAVEYLLERGARAGERKLADLVYELAKACLVVVKDIDRRVQLESRPRHHADIRRDVAGVATRLQSNGHGVIGSPPMLGGGDDAMALRAAESCIAILERLEGDSGRQQLSKAVWLINFAKPGDAEVLLNRMLQSDSTTDLRLHIVHNLLWSLLLQKKYEQVVEAGQAGLAEFPNDWICTYNITAARACIGERRKFEEAAARLRALDKADPMGQEFRHGLLRFEVAHFAETLGVSSSEVERALGIHRAGTTAVHEVG